MPGQIKSYHGAMLVLAAALPLLLAAREAAAQDCQNDADCGAGARCAVGTSVSCWGCGTTTPGGPGEHDSGVSVPSGVDGGCANSGCTTTEYHYCTAAFCNTDADCPSSMVCHTETWQDCTGYPCKPGGDCASDDAGFSCTDHTQSTCSERYNLPCRADADCGEGFECNRSPTTTCSGGGGVVPNADGGYTIIDAGSSCTTEQPETGYCNLLTLPCATDTECPTGLSCQTISSYPPCTIYPQDASTVPADAAVIPGKAEGDTYYYDCPPPEQSMVCRPERWAGGSVGGTTGGLGGTFGGSGGATDAGVDTPPGDPTSPGAIGGGTLGGGAFGGATAGGAGGGVGGSAVDAGTGQGPGDSDDDEHGHHHGGGLRSVLRHLFGSGGCSVGATQAEGNLAWLTLLSVFLVWRRPRRSANAQ